jgi:hypothetical protein
MKRRRNPEVPAPVIALACFAAGGALAWWLTRSSTPALPVPNAFVPPATQETTAAILARAAATAGRSLSRQEQAAVLAANGVAAPVEYREGVILPTPEEQAAIDLYNAQFRNGATPIGPGANAIIGAVLAGGRTPEAETAAALERIRSGGSRKYLA